jgi:ABC-type glycerol-3-phosphate transport system permease component
MWNAYFGPMLFLNREEKYPLQVFLRQIVIVAQSNEAEMSKTGAKTGQIVAESVKAAVLVVSAAPILVFYPFMQKYFVKGILIGAIKG